MACTSMFPDLTQFLGSYFHQDWDMFETTDRGVLQQFVKEVPRAVVESIIAEISKLQRMEIAECDLRALLHEMGCQYYPGETVSYCEWLEHVRNSLAGSLQR